MCRCLCATYQTLQQCQKVNQPGCSRTAKCYLSVSSSVMWLFPYRPLMSFKNLREVLYHITLFYQPGYLCQCACQLPHKARQLYCFVYEFKPQLAALLCCISVKPQRHVNLLYFWLPQKEPGQLFLGASKLNANCWSVTPGNHLMLRKSMYSVTRW